MAIVKDRRIFELALKGLEAERDRISYEIAELSARLGGRVAKARRKRATRAVAREVTKTTRRAARTVKKKVATAKKRTRKMSAAQRKAISERMKATWARRKAKKK